MEESWTELQAIKLVNNLNFINGVNGKFSKIINGSTCYGLLHC